MEQRRKKIHGYDGPTGAYVAAAGSLLPLTDAAAHLALVDSALLTALGPTEKAAEYASEVAQGHGAVSR